MAASIRIIRSLCCKSTLISQPFRHYKSYLQRAPVRTGPSLSARQSQCFCKAASLHDEAATQASEAQTRYKDRPWDYLESEGSWEGTEYAEKYGSSPVWASYRRNHKGGIPPQKTRKTCIRGDQICGNPCPICRDPNIIIHHQNVKLLQQFISPHTGMVYDPTRTGVCMKQQKNLDKAVVMARDHGLLPFQIPHVEFSGEDYSNSHHAVGSTPPPPCLLSGSIWYSWYGEITPDSRDVAKVKKTYKAYLK